MRVRADVGMVFQELALFDSLTVAENVGYRLSEEMHLPPDQVRTRVEDVLSFIGLGEFTERMPSALSGGQRRRVAIARAMAPTPSLILFDDPTTGLDPIIASTVDDEIVKLRDLQGVTSIFVTQQIRDAFYIASHRAVRQNGRIEVVAATDEEAAPAFLVLRNAGIHSRGTAAELMASPDAYLREFLYMTLPPW
jgi:phospholipid/cholesterol/gamma-HCH transport system ATP-binding protein